MTQPGGGSRPTPLPTLGGGNGGPDLGGDQPHKSSDPTFTRWLPLGFSPLVSSQPFRTQAGALPAPWGNVNCNYSIALRQDVGNYDTNSSVLGYQPFGGATDYTNPGPPYQTIPPRFDEFQSAWVITDANGDRLNYDTGWHPYPDVHSTLTVNNDGTYTLSKAGPPGAIRQQGAYTYTFQRNVGGAYAGLIRIQDDAGNQQNLTWGGAPLLTVSDVTSGRQLKFNAGSGGYVGSVDTPLGSGYFSRTALTYDGGGHLTNLKVYESDGLTLRHTDTYTYGPPNGDCITARNTGGVQSSYQFTADTFTPDYFGVAIGRMNSLTLGSSGDGSAGTWTYTYGPLQQGYNNWGVSARTNTMTDPNGSIFRTMLELTDGASGKVVATTQTGPDFTGAPTGYNAVRTAYIPDSTNPTSVIVSGADVTQFGANPWHIDLTANGQISGVTDPLLHTWNANYNADGKPTTYTDPTSGSFTLGWGENGAAHSRLTSLTLPTTSLSVLYNAFGQPLAFTIPAAGSASGSSESSTFAYQATTGDLLSATSPLSDVLSLTGRDALGDLLGVAAYPDTGNPTTSTTPLTVGITYDAAQHPTTITGPSGTQQVITYNDSLPTRSQVVRQSTTLAQADTTYDSRGRAKQVTDTVGLLLGYGYDQTGNITGLTDGNSHTTQFRYGLNNESTRVTWPDTAHADLLYNANGTPAKATDERGVVSNFTYDFAHRVTDVTYPTSASESVHYTYDNANRLLTAADGNSSRTYTYDATTKRLSSVSTLLAGLPAGHNTFLVSYTYYPDGSVQTVTTPVGVTRYGYLKNGKLQTLSDPFGNITTYTYDHAGRVTKQSTLTVGGRTIATAYTWGVSGQAGDSSTAPAYLRQITHSVNGAALWTYTLQHSYLGQLTSQQGATSQTGRSSSEQWAYDGRGRMSNHAITVQAPTGNLSANGTFGYDLAGNTDSTSATGGTWGYNTSNQLTSAPAAAELAGGSSLTYDAAGNLKTCNGLTLTWSNGGNLSGLSGTGVSATYVYDGAGRRVGKTAGGQTGYWLYAGGVPYAELNSSGNVVRAYTWGPLGLISDTAGTTTRVSLFDGASNLREIIDGSTGSVLWQGGWQAWGASVGSAPPAAFGYKGQWGAYTDGESGLLLMGARYYAPALGRFVSRDPSSFASGPNLYAFCWGDPVNVFDPNGCDPESFNDQLWHGIRILHGIEKALSGPLGGGITGSLLGAHDAVANAGEMHGLYDAGKVPVWKVLAADYGAAKATGEAGMALYGAAMGAGALLNEAGAAEGACGRPGECFLPGTRVLVVRPALAAARPTLLVQVTALSGSKLTLASLSSGTMHPSAVAASRVTEPSRASSATRLVLLPIEQLRAGDLAVSRNPRTGKTEYKRVLRPTQSHASVLLAVTLADKQGHRETITATRQHPFYVSGKGFVPAGGLAVGNSIVTRAGPSLTVKAIQWKRSADGWTVYNAVIEDDHTYFVGTLGGGAWVHNGDCQLTMEDDLGLPPKTEPTEWHHPYPKYLGGPEQQSLVGLPRSYHQAIHRALDRIFPRQAGAAAYNFPMNDPGVEQVLDQIYNQWPLGDPVTGVPFPWRK